MQFIVITSTHALSDYRKIAENKACNAIFWQFIDTITPAFHVLTNKVFL